MIFRYYLFYNDPPKEHLTAKGFRGFVVEFNTYNIPAVESPVTYPFLAGRTSIIPVEAAVATADTLPALLIITGHEHQKSRTPYVKNR